MHENGAGKGRPFDFFADTFSYVNELYWEYRFDDVTGVTTIHTRTPPPRYALHCFVVVRAARQFFYHANFVPGAAKLEAVEYRQKIREIVSRSDFRPSPPDRRVDIPGFANLRQFSESHADLLRAHCGGAWQSYTQRGNWRMVLPFSRRHQESTAAELRQRLTQGVLPLVHVVNFPRLTINHAVMVLANGGCGETNEFQCYDPNISTRLLELRFDSVKRTFVYPRTHYFLGGPVNVYEIYRGLFL